MDISIICVPYQLDVARWAYALGPQAFLDAGLIERLEAAGHRVETPVWIELPRAERSRDTVTNLGRIAQHTSAAVAAALNGQDSSSRLVLVLEGDCSHAVGAMGGIARAGITPGVVWIDAHADLHTYATTGTGYIGGMPYAVALGWDLEDWRLAAGLEEPVHAEAAALLGASDLDPEEEVVLEAHAIARADAADLVGDDSGEGVAGLLRSRAAAAQGWYLHVDVDVAGPEAVPGGLTPTPRPLTRAALLRTVHESAQSVPVRVLALATYNPAGDPDGRGAGLGLEVIDAALEGIGARRAVIQTI